MATQGRPPLQETVQGAVTSRVETESSRITIQELLRTPISRLQAMSDSDIIRQALLRDYQKKIALSSSFSFGSSSLLARRQQEARSMHSAWPSPNQISGANAYLTIVDETDTLMKPEQLEQPISEDTLISASEIESKYEFVLSDTKRTLSGNTVTRIRALKNIPNTLVYAGDLGGYIERKENLDDSLTSGAWVHDNAIVESWARVQDNAHIYGNSRVKGHAIVKDNVVVTDDVIVGDYACLSESSKARHKALIVGYAKVRGRSIIEGNAVISENAIVGLENSKETTWIKGQVQIHDEARIFGQLTIDGPKEMFIGGQAYIYDENQLFYCKCGYFLVATPTLKETEDGIEIAIGRNSYTPKHLLISLSVAHSTLPWHRAKTLFTLAKDHVLSSQREEDEQLARDESLWI